jgi:hypothetical protein
MHQNDVRALRWIGSEVREPPTFYGMDDLEDILMKFELEEVEIQILPVLYIVLKDTPTRW